MPKESLFGILCVLIQDISKEWGCNQLYLLVCVFLPTHGADADPLLAVAAVHVFGLKVSLTMS